MLQQRKHRFRFRYKTHGGKIKALQKCSCAVQSFSRSIQKKMTATETASPLYPVKRIRQTRKENGNSKISKTLKKTNYVNLKDRKINQPTNQPTNKPTQNLVQKHPNFQLLAARSFLLLVCSSLTEHSISFLVLIFSITTLFNHFKLSFLNL